LCEGIRGREVCILGGSADLEDKVRRGMVDDCRFIIAVDGAARLALEYGVKPSLIVGDADGGFAPIIALSEHGVPIVLHVHGDNYWSASLLVPRLRRFLLTVQCSPLPPYTWVVPGFTDGERALGLALTCRASTIKAYGMNVNMPVGWWSKPWLRGHVQPWGEKRLKLMIARLVFEAFGQLAPRYGSRIVWL
jgi:uncharacterized Rossmann fold enzyme